MGSLVELRRRLKSSGVSSSGSQDRPPASILGTNVGGRASVPRTTKAGPQPDLAALPTGRDRWAVVVPPGRPRHHLLAQAQSR